MSWTLRGLILRGHKVQDANFVLHADSHKPGCLIADFLSLHELGEVLKRYLAEPDLVMGQIQGQQPGGFS